MAYPSILRFTRPKTFLYVMSLRTGTELITLTQLVNKLTGVYGILALFTGLRLSYMQLSMYIYSIIALLLVAWLAPHIRKQSPLQCLALAWFYVLDSIINALYTVAFGASWFLVLAEHNSAQGGGGKKTGLGTGMMGDTAGFTNPSVTVSQVEVVPTSHPSATGDSAVHVGSGAALVGHERRSTDSGANGATPGVSGMLGDTILQSGSIASITVISTLWIIRVYFILVIMAYARGVLRQHIILLSASTNTSAGSKTTPLPRLNTGATTSAAATTQPAQGGAVTPPITQIPSNETTPNANAVSSQLSHQQDFKASLEPRPLPSPFHPPSSQSAGWPGKLGRIFVSIFPSYWLGPANEGEENAIFDSGIAVGRESQSTPGVFERERRRRAGTGPPMLKPIELERVRK